jgi:hypothetical protein
VAEIVLGITAHQLAFVASNSPLDFRRSLAGLNLELSNCGHPLMILRCANIFFVNWLATVSTTTFSSRQR